MLIHVFLLMKNPGEWQNHKCTHFNIINIIWLPPYNPQSPGFYLPMAAEEESQNHFYIICTGSQPPCSASLAKEQEAELTNTANRN